MEKNNTRNILVSIKKLGQPVFTTHEITAISGKSPSTIVHSLKRLADKGLVTKIYHGIWAEAGSQKVSGFEIIPHIFPQQRVYVSFISALHLYGILEQIPQVITLASTAHTTTVRTAVGIYEVHQISSALFNGFDWYKGKGNFLIAEPEKALVDSLYLSSRKKKQFGYFPELYFPPKFSFKKAEEWVNQIREVYIKNYIFRKLKKLRTIQIRSK